MESLIRLSEALARIRFSELVGISFMDITGKVVSSRIEFMNLSSGVCTCR